jgi:hypothetical protein
MQEMTAHTERRGERALRFWIDHGARRLGKTRFGVCGADISPRPGAPAVAGVSLHRNDGQARRYYHVYRTVPVPA